MMPNKTLHIAVLGGGPCGLYAARVLTRAGYQVTVIDKGERPGGLATSNRNGNNWYDMGVHMLHAFDQQIFEDIKTLMGDERLEVELNAKIKWAGSSYRYPLQFVDMIKGIPFFKLCRQVFALFSAQIKHYFKPKKPKDAEEALIQLYGKPLYKFFFESFTQRYWGIHPREMSATFITTKMPKLTAVEVLKKGLEKIGIKQKAQSVDSALTKETLHYSANGAEAMPRSIAREIMRLGGTILQNAEVSRVKTAGHRIIAVNYIHNHQVHEISCDACISTIPLTNLIQSFYPPCSAEIVDSAKRLRYKPIVVYGLLVNKPKCLDALYVYHRDRVFHRIGEPKNGGLNVTPSDHTVLIVEMTCEVGDEKWRGDESIKQRLFDDLEDEGICKREDIVEMHLNHNRHGYPIFDLGFEPHLEKVQKFLAGFENLHSSGRQGAFTYPNMHSAMRMGWQAAEKVKHMLSTDNIENKEKSKKMELV